MIQGYATQYENKSVLAFGQNQKDSNRKDMQEVYRLNLVVLMPVSVLDVCDGVFFIQCFPHPKSNEFALIGIGLVIDGSIAYPFNDGAKVLLEVHPDDALLTVVMDDQR